MKILFDSRGVSLVILVIAMTVIAFLGASFVSLIATKQKSFIYQNDSYRALNLANSGIEYAIQYVGSNTKTSANTDDFFHTTSTYSDIPVVSSVPDPTSLASSQWKQISFGSGSFYLSFYINLSDPDNTDSNKVLYSVGKYHDAKRVVKLRKFLQYASPSMSGLGTLNLVPNNHPYISGKYVIVPFLHIYDTNLTLTSINFELDSTDNSTKHLETIYYGSTSSSFSSIYQASDYWTWSTWCEWGSSAPCYSSSDDTIHIPDTGTTDKLSFSSKAINGHYIRWLYFGFKESGTSLKGIYTIRFNYTSGSVSDQAIIKFSL